MSDVSSKAATGDLLVVVDAGGTKTAAWLVDPSRAGENRVLGRGRATAGNPLAVGFEEASRAIRESITLACKDAGITSGRAERAVLSVAGAANERLRKQFSDWARECNFAHRVAIVSDVLPVLAAGTPNCCGVALISGTGSVAYGRAADGRAFLRGGWGFLLGDEGSGYSIGRAALRNTLSELETGTVTSPLADAVARELGVEKVLELTRAIYGSPQPRVAIAGIAPYVISLASEGDADAQSIIDTAAQDLASLVGRTVQAVEPIESPVALAAAGGILLSSKRMQDQLHVALRRSGLDCNVTFVSDPLVGCIRLASPECDGMLLTWQ